jgi:hypothetical protein
MWTWTTKPATTLTMWTGKKLTHLFPPSKKNSQTAEVEKSNTGLAHVNDITEGLVYNKVCAQRMLCQLMPKIKTGSMSANIPLLWKWGYWFSVLHCYRGQEQGATLQPGTEKPVTSSPHLSQKEKKSKTLSYAGKCILPVAWYLKHHTCIPGAHGQRYNKQLPDLHEGPTEAETMNTACSLGKKSLYPLNMIISDPTLLLPLQQQ